MPLKILESATLPTERFLRHGPTHVDLRICLDRMRDTPLSLSRFTFTYFLDTDRNYRETLATRLNRFPSILSALSSPTAGDAGIVRSKLRNSRGPCSRLSGPRGIRGREPCKRSGKRPTLECALRGLRYEKIDHTEDR